ncbi:MAG: indolepyruvate ferredoxin oxidoreductase family protein, partial [Paracoccaceae bacterium]
LPWFCSGCPHNTSTKVPEGSRAYAGIGCHYMVLWMDRETSGFTHMGGEGANWIGESAFSNTNHVFQNIGDGTYNHSGIQAIRAAIAAGDVNITYKVLYNDAVAMTGGQKNDGDLSAEQIAAELIAMRIKKLVVIYDEKEDVDFAALPKGVETAERRNLMEVQERMREVGGVSAILYIQTCAAEKRRRRKRRLFPDPNKRIFINPDVCEGCGDCGVQSNCVSIVPLETELGRKREIDQSSCNKDFSCVNGFCPSFVSLEGAQVKKPERAVLELPDLPMPKLPTINGTHNIIITGVGGTGVVTVGALLGMAAHLEGKGVGMMEMAGLAQKGGAVHIHCRVAEKPEDISAIRVAVGEADAIIGGDLVTTSGSKTLGLMTRGRSKAVCNSHQIITGDFTQNKDFSLPVDRMRIALKARLGEGALAMLNATKLAEKFMADAIYANVLMLGAAWQAGLIPMSLESIKKAIELNGAGVESNLLALKVGRWAVAFPAESTAALNGANEGMEEIDGVEFRAQHLRKYQNDRLAKRYLKRVATAKAVDTEFGAALSKGYHKLLAYKDEYEVARLHRETLEAAVAEHFTDVRSMRFHMAPPIFGKKDKQGRAIKSEFGPWMMTAFGLLAALKGLRGTPLDVFGCRSERKIERRLIKEYVKTMDEIEATISGNTRDLAIALAELPLDIRGFGHVKMANAAAAAKKREGLLAAFRAGGSPQVQAAE